MVASSSKKASLWTPKYYGQIPQGIFTFQGHNKWLWRLEKFLKWHNLVIIITCTLTRWFIGCSCHCTMVTLIIASMCDILSDICVPVAMLWNFQKPSQFIVDGDHNILDDTDILPWPICRGLLPSQCVVAVGFGYQCNFY